LLAFGSLHTATPGTTGASENAATGGYARQASTYGNASSGSKATTATETYSTAGTTAVTDAGQWTLVTAGTYGIGLHLASSVIAATITFAAGAKTLSSS